MMWGLLNVGRRSANHQPRAERKSGKKKKEKSSSK